MPLKVTQGHLVLNKFSDCLNFWILFFKLGAVPNSRLPGSGRVQNRTKNRKLNSPKKLPLFACMQTASVLFYKNSRTCAKLVRAPINRWRGFKPRQQIWGICVSPKQ